MKKPESFLKQAWELHIEKVKTRKALRLLSKQEWSIEFLTALLIRAANLSNRPYEMTIQNGNSSIVIKSASAQSAYRDDSIFNHLDDELRVRQFIDEVNR